MLKCICYLSFLYTLITAIPTFGQSNIENLKIVAQSNPDSLIKLIKNDETLSLKGTEEIFLLSSAYNQLGEYLKVDSLIRHAFSTSDFKQDSALYIEYLMLLADQRKIINDFESSLTYLSDAVKYCNKNLDTINLASVYIAFGETYRAIENFKFGLEYLDKAEELIEHYGDRFPLKILAKLYNRKVAILIEKNVDFDLILTLSLKTIEIASQLGDKDLEASSYNSLGFHYINENPQNPPQIAEQYFLKAILIWDDLGSEIHATNARLNLSRYYNRTKEYTKGLNVLLPIHEMVDQSEWIWEKGGYYEMLGRLYYGLGDYKMAFLYSDRSKEKLLELNENQYNKRLALLSVKHDVQREKAKFIQQKKEALLAKLETKAKEDENNTLYIILLSVFIIALAILVFLIISNQQKQKLSKQQKENVLINNQLSNLISQKETLLSEVNHRVKNNLSILSSLLYLQQKKETSPEIKSSINKSRNRINTMALIHESLYQRDDMEHVNFQDYLTKLLHSNKSIYWDDATIKLNVDCSDLSPDLSTSVPLAMIINELITNSFKYAFQETDTPRIEVVFKENTIQYMDNGKGIESTEGNRSLGSKIMTLFSEQINASVHSFTDKDGYHHHIKLSIQ